MGETCTMVKAPKLYLHVIGNIPSSFTNMVIGILEEFYDSIRTTSLPLLVEVFVYENTILKLRVLEEEARSSGVLVIGDFITLHEAWRGWPRIHVDYEKTCSLENRYVKALLVHEATHSILHGSPLYYLVSISPELIETYGFENALRLVYTASTIVKDLEVHGFLVRQGYIDQVRAYMEFVLEKQFEDIGCRSLLENLQLAKLISPLVYIDELLNLEKKLPSSCRGRIDRILTILKEIVEQEGNLDQKTYRVLQRVMEVTGEIQQ